MAGFLLHTQLREEGHPENPSAGGVDFQLERGWCVYGVRASQMHFAHGNQIHHGADAR